MRTLTTGDAVKTLEMTQEEKGKFLLMMVSEMVLKA